MKLVIGLVPRLVVGGGLQTCHGRLKITPDGRYGYRLSNVTRGRGGLRSVTIFGKILEKTVNESGDITAIEAEPTAPNDHQAVAAQVFADLKARRMDPVQVVDFLTSDGIADCYWPDLNGQFDFSRP